MLQELHTVLGKRSKERELRQLAREGVVQPSSDGAQDTDKDVDRTRQSSGDDDDDNKQMSVLRSELSCEKSPDELGAMDSESGGSRTNKYNPTTDDDESEGPASGLPRPYGLPPPPIGLPFMTSVAVEAVMKSKLRGALMEETFGQGDDNLESSEDED